MFRVKKAMPVPESHCKVNDTQPAATPTPTPCRNELRGWSGGDQWQKRMGNLSPLKYCRWGIIGNMLACCKNCFQPAHNSTSGICLFGILEGQYVTICKIRYDIVFFENHNFPPILTSTIITMTSPICTVPSVWSTVACRTCGRTIESVFRPLMFNRDLSMKPLIIICERMIRVSSCCSVCVLFNLHNTKTHTHTHISSIQNHSSLDA